MKDFKDLENIPDAQIELDIEETRQELLDLERRIRFLEDCVEKLKPRLEERRKFIKELNDLIFWRRARRVQEKT